MAATITYDDGADLGLLDGKTVAILGYGSQGHAHALNLKESGIDVIVGLRPGKSWEKAQADGLTVVTVDEAVRRGGPIMCLVEAAVPGGPIPGANQPHPQARKGGAVARC